MKKLFIICLTLSILMLGNNVYAWSSPSGSGKATGAGIIVRLLGAPLLIVLLNKQFKRFNMNLGALPEKGKELNEYLRNMYDVIMGKRDWNTGVIKNVEDLEYSFVKVETAQGSILVEQGDVEAYLASLGTGAEEAAEDAKKLADEIAKENEEVAKADKELEKYYNKLDTEQQKRQ